MEVGWEYMVGSGISRAVRREDADGLDETKAWECIRSQGRECKYLFFYFLF